MFARTNRILNGSAPSVYINRIERADKVKPDDLDNYLKSHLNNTQFIRSDNFDDFFANRAKDILDLISKAMGKSIANRDSEETILAFGKSL